MMTRRLGVAVAVLNGYLVKNRISLEAQAYKMFKRILDSMLSVALTASVHSIPLKGMTLEKIHGLLWHQCQRGGNI